MDKIEALEIIHYIRSLLYIGTYDDGAYAKDARGVWTRPWANNCVGWSLRGAYLRVTDEQPFDATDPNKGKFAKLKQLLHRHNNGMWTSDSYIDGGKAEKGFELLDKVEKEVDSWK